MHRAWGCALVALGAALVPWTYGLSLVVLGGVDFLLHRRLRNAVVCYRCDTVYRDAVPIERQGEFDLLKHDVLKYGKSWDTESDDQRAQDDDVLGEPSPGHGRCQRRDYAAASAAERSSAAGLVSSQLKPVRPKWP